MFTLAGMAVQLRRNTQVSLKLSNRLVGGLPCCLGAPNALSFINDNMSPLGRPLRPLKNVWRKLMRYEQFRDTIHEKLTTRLGFRLEDFVNGVKALTGAWSACD